MNVLLIQLKRIGDLILTVPVIAAVRKHFPAAKISLVVAHGSRELLPAIPGVDRAFVASGRASDVALWFAIGTAKFDDCLDFSRTDRSAFLTLLSGARSRVTYDSGRSEPIRQLSYNRFIPSQVRTVHTVDHHLALLAPLGVHDASPQIQLALPDATQRKAAEIIAAQQLGDDFIVIHPGSARAEKFWEARRWAEVANEFQAKEPARFVVTGGSSAMEQDHIAQIKAHVQQPLVDLSGRIDLLTLAALIQRARLLITVDSAPMHLAAAFGTPQVVLFGPTNPLHWRPRAAPAVVLHGSGSWELRDFAARQAPATMKEISTAQVIDAMQSLLSKPAARVS
ncbi:MAG: putative lipopolysaccharide heptosyltransferase III [Chthoniobacterales bacterium]|nr:putative lipopolysaccharide heptosyltransferase III [Chthoniobacterales bacterium]